MQWPERPSCHLSAHPPDDAPSWRDGLDGQGFRICRYCHGMHPEDLLRALDSGATLELADMKYGWPHKFYVGKVPDTRYGTEIENGSSTIRDMELLDWLRTVSRDDERIMATALREGIELDPRLLAAERSRELWLAARPGCEQSPGPLARAVDRLRAVAARPPSSWLTLRSDPYVGPAPRHAHAKFYNDHFRDDGLDDEAFAALAAAVLKHGGVEFERDEVGVRFRMGARPVR